MPEQTPSIGRIVHFVYGGRHIPAIISDPAYAPVEIAPGEIGAGQALTVFPVNQTPFTTVAVCDPGGADATWHWPEYVPTTE